MLSKSFNCTVGTPLNHHSPADRVHTARPGSGLICMTSNREGCIKSMPNKGEEVKNAQK